ncbi:MAG: TrmH family RNA methyltransferase [Geminicoccaceae bacterium]|nr:TrmH family RNA methyltransferase [Geminicoccaceae bacterium]MCS7268897.1 TrmH family RNA methyltransferase [Geminicoccaceae bacterium]MCX7629568.1 TrmH family RNA methyltransferase [Geminicoccaceae bacterium]MDW8125183.1 TrmH family RNA methyltransferase [Geminicoccaceae bacterium]MDW8342003.1 TrmH family RNA methyltransferase [Geminicoccaceae bacterium]
MPKPLPPDPEAARSAAIARSFAALARDPSRLRLDGLHPLKHGLRFGAEVELAVSPDKEALLALARELCPDLVERLRALVEPVPPALFAALGPPPPSPVLAIARRPPSPDAALLLDDPDPAPIVLLERPVHAGNLGAVVRVAAALGARAVLALGGADPWTPAALRGSSGLHFAIPVLRLEEPPELGDRPLLAFHAEGDPLDAAPLPVRAVFAFGSERHGLSPSLRARARALLAIPMRPGVSSLNLATAVAIALWTFGLGLSRSRAGP